MTDGVIYIATGAEFVEQALVSAQSVRQFMPGLGITLFTDQPVQSALVDAVIPIAPTDQRFHMQKVEHISYTPYRRTLFLDVDTYVCADLSDLFTLLDHFDIALAHAPLRVSDKIPRVPASFPEFNTGVILFNNTLAVKAVFEKWLALYEHYSAYFVIDQPALREALYYSRLRIATLTPEYNCRFQASGFVCGDVKILHGYTEAQHYPAVVQALNQHTNARLFIAQRVLNLALKDHSNYRETGEYQQAALNKPPNKAYTPSLTSLVMPPANSRPVPGWRIFVTRLWRSLQQRGWRETASIIARKLLRC